MKSILNIKITYCLFFAAIITLSGCDDFLNVVPRDKVSSDIVFRTKESMESALGGVYDHMTYSAEGFAIVAQSLGIYNFILASDWRGQDIIPKNTSQQWMADDYDFSSRTMEKTRPAFFWSYAYGHINVVNDLLANMTNMQGTSQEKAQIEGEARGLRAFNYWL